MPLPSKISDISSIRMNKLFDDAVSRWEGVYQEFSRGNKNLYLMLQSCYQFHAEACLNREAYVEALIDVGIKPRDTSEHGLLLYSLKLIFGMYADGFDAMGEDRHRELSRMAVYITRWTQALQTCAAEGVKPNKIADYMSKNGGVKALAKGDDNTAEVHISHDGEIEDRWHELTSKPLFTKKLAKDVPLGPGKVVLVAEVTDDRELRVVGKYPMQEEALKRAVLKVK